MSQVGEEWNEGVGGLRDGVAAVSPEDVDVAVRSLRAHVFAEGVAGDDRIVVVVGREIRQRQREHAVHRRWERKAGARDPYGSVGWKRIPAVMRIREVHVHGLVTLLR